MAKKPALVNRAFSPESVRGCPRLRMDIAPLALSRSRIAVLVLRSRPSSSEANQVEDDNENEDEKKLHSAWD